MSVAKTAQADPVVLGRDDSLSVYREHISSEEGEEDTAINVDVDWEEVKEGRAAGLPGQWIPTSVEPEPNPSRVTGDELYDALKLKAAVYADHQWQAYWSTHGPSYLAQTWREQYPHIPLEDVDTACGLGFLCQSLEDKMQLNVSDDMTTGAGMSDKSVAQCSDPKHVCSDSQVLGEDTQDMDTGSKPPKEDLISMWNTFYNSAYWYVYSLFKAPESAIESAMPDEEVVVVEEEVEEVDMVKEEVVEEVDVIDDVCALPDNYKVREPVIEEDSASSDCNQDDTTVVNDQPVNRKAKKKHKKKVSYRDNRDYQV